MTAAARVHSLEIARLSKPWIGPLLDFYREFEVNGDAVWFKPHPFTEQYLETLCRGGKGDFHCVLVAEDVVLGYGLLRGWDEGFDIPSLGIAISARHRGCGLGSLLMHFLHCAARLRGAPRVRLRVNENNHAAIALYQHMGYQFEPSGTSEGPLRVAFRQLML